MAEGCWSSEARKIEWLHTIPSAKKYFKSNELYVATVSSSAKTNFIRACSSFNECIISKIYIRFQK